MAPQAKSLFGGDEQVLACVLPHHLFIMAAASVSKQNDIYPLTKMATDGNVIKDEKNIDKSLSHTQTKPSIVNELQGDHNEDEIEEEYEGEERLIKEINCTVTRQADDGGLSLKLLLKLEDDMNRQLCRTICEQQTGIDLATELVEFCLISELDRDKVAGIIQKCITTAV